MTVCETRHHISADFMHVYSELELVKPDTNKERRGQWEKKRGGGEKWGREVERLLLSSSKSIVNNTGNYQGRQKKLWRRGSGEREA